MKRHLFIAHSYYMLLVLMQIKYTFLKDECVDLIISDVSKGSHIIFERLNAEKYFSKCYYMNDNIIYSSKDKTLKKINKLITAAIKPEKSLKLAGLEHIDYNYDTMYCYLDIRIQEQAIFNIIKSKNPKAECYVYEEGLSSYFSRDGILSSTGSKSAKIMMLLLMLMGKKDMILRNNKKGAYFFSPELIQYDLQVPICTIPKINKNSWIIYNLVNKVFKYDEGEVDAEYIYLEDFSYVEGNLTDDIEMINIIKNFCDKKGKKIAVKLHPRSPDNRFKNIGINTVKTNAPLEIIMSSSKDTKVLITIASGGPIICLNNFDSDIYVIMLYKCSKYKSYILDNKAFERYVYSTIEMNDANRLFIPENLEQLQAVLEKLGHVTG